MMRAMYSPLALGLAALALATAPFVLDADTPAPAQEAAATRLAIRAGTVHTMAGDPITDGVILIENGLVTAVGPAASVRIPAGVRVLEARVAVPGLIDAHSCVGLAGWLNIEHDKDEVDRTGSAQPELRAIDAYNTREPLVKWLRGFGVTTVHTGHGPLALISGQTMITKTFGDTVEDAVLVPEAMVAACMTRPRAATAAPAPAPRSWRSCAST
jgi:imidazolonepropionase-like amidohydrolase